MLVSLHPVPFADAGRQRQFEAVAAALHADATAPATILLGNLGAWTPVAADALLIRPTSVVLLFLTPRAGELALPELPGLPWRLDGQPLADPQPAGNPLARYQQQVPLALAWLSEQLGVPATELPPCAGLALFDAPLTFGAGVETNLHRQAADYDFQLVGGASALPPRLPVSHPEAAALSEAELLDWADYLTNEPYVAHQQGVAESTTEYLAQKFRQLWRWLGAEDIPADPPYGAPDLAQRDQQEQARLHQLRQDLQAELAQQRREAAAREATYTRELTQLRQQVTQAGQPAAARQAEQRAQAALEAEMRAARAELADRHRELDARIQELGRLMQQLQAQASAKPAAAPAISAAGSQTSPRQPARVAAPPPRATSAATKPAQPLLKLSSYRPLRRAERWGVLIMGLTLLGGGTWGVVHLVKQSAGHGRLATAGRAASRPLSTEAQRPAPVIVYDTLTGKLAGNDNDEHEEEIAESPPSPDAMPVNASSNAPLATDSAQPAMTDAPALPRDTTATEP